MRLAAALALLSACSGSTYQVGRITPAVHVRDTAFQGAEVSTSWEGHGVGIWADAQAQRLSRPVFDGTQSRIGGGVDFGLRFSLFGFFDGDHRIDHWFDVGASAVGGGGLVYPARLTTFGEGWVGGWVAFGLYPGRRHPALVLEARRVAVTDWDNMTIFTIGIGLADRYTEVFDLRD